MRCALLWIAARSAYNCGCPVWIAMTCVNMRIWPATCAKTSVPACWSTPILRWRAKWVSVFICARHNWLPSQPGPCRHRSEGHTSELQTLMRNSYAVCCEEKKIILTDHNDPESHDDT